MQTYFSASGPCWGPSCGCLTLLHNSLEPYGMLFRSGAIHKQRQGIPKVNSVARALSGSSLLLVCSRSGSSCTPVPARAQSRRISADPSNRALLHSLRSKESSAELATPGSEPTTFKVNVRLVLVRAVIATRRGPLFRGESSQRGFPDFRQRQTRGDQPVRRRATPEL